MTVTAPCRRRRRPRLFSSERRCVTTSCPPPSSRIPHHPLGPPTPHLNLTRRASCLLPSNPNPAAATVNRFPCRLLAAKGLVGLCRRAPRRGEACRRPTAKRCGKGVPTASTNKTRVVPVCVAHPPRRPEHARLDDDARCREEEDLLRVPSDEAGARRVRGAERRGEVRDAHRSAQSKSAQRGLQGLGNAPCASASRRLVGRARRAVARAACRAMRSVLHAAETAPRAKAGSSRAGGWHRRAPCAALEHIRRVVSNVPPRSAVISSDGGGGEGAASAASAARCSGCGLASFRQEAPSPAAAGVTVGEGGLHRRATAA